ncbi:MAG TPA: pyridoxal phosphate-dependent aminotransferase [Planctomycetota bacterium]|nr:pyridoxal phosphate-dependent aminotransferase [Planctomycetota bacterium]
MTHRMSSVQLPVIPIVGELIREHPGTISLGQGVVNYGPPPSALERMNDFFKESENHKYKPVEGIAPLLEALAAKLAAQNRVAVNERNRLVVTAGGNMAFMNAILAIADPGDEIVLLAPFYFNHEMAVCMADCKPVIVWTDENFQPRLDAIAAAITPRTRAIVTISPNNPTGAVYSEESLRAINSLCRERGVYHISDEAYEDFVYGNAAHFSSASIPGAAPHTISLYSLSKSYGFASWRVGYMLIPEHLFVSIKKIQDTILICPPVISQYAALGALDGGSNYVRERVKEIEATRAHVREALQSVQDICRIPRADGALYFFLYVNAPLKPMQLVERLVKEHRVAAIPGDAFGATDCCSLRISFGALKRETVEEGIGRLASGLRALI